MKNRWAPELYGDYEYVGETQRASHQVFKDWIERCDLVFLDTETTGLGVRDEIVEFAVCDIWGNKLMESLVRPIAVTSWREAQRIHRISPEDVAEAPTWAELSPRIHRLLKGKLILIYNASFDIRLMAQSSKASGSPALDFNVACVMLEYAKWRGIWSWRRQSWRWHKLDHAAANLELRRVGHAHRALSDAMLTAAVCREIGQRSERSRASPEKAIVDPAGQDERG